MFELYDYQREVIDKLRAAMSAGHGRLILALPTGAGKTVIAAFIARSAVGKGKRVLFIVHLKTLVQQAVRHFTEVGLNVGILRGDETNFSEANDIIVASIQTIRSRGAPDWVDLVLIDEVHHLHKDHVKLMEGWSAIRFIGLSATPLREDMGKYFTSLVRGPTIRELTDMGKLVPVQAFAPGGARVMEILSGVRTNAGDFVQSELGETMNQRELIGDLVQTYIDKGENRQAICFAIDKAHSRSIVESLNAENIPAEHIEDRTPDADRRRIFAAYAASECRVLSSVGVLSVGFDMPVASCVILARPTLSLALYIQQVGRGLRPHEGKTDCLVLDHAGNCIRHGLPLHFEVPDLNDREHATAGQQKKKRSAVACKECGFILDLDPGQETCPECGTDRPRRQSDVIYTDDQLARYGDAAEPPVLVDQKSVYLQLKQIANERGYKPGWTAHKYREKFGAWAPASWAFLSGEQPTPALRRWIRGKEQAWLIAQKKGRRSA